MVTFESLGMVSYSPSIVTMAVSVTVCEKFCVKEWHDLENQVRGRSRSLKMAPFDRPYATFYWSAIVNIIIIKPSLVARHAHKSSALLLLLLLLRINVIATLQSIDFKVAATAKSCGESESESRSSKVL